MTFETPLQPDVQIPDLITHIKNATNIIESYYLTSSLTTIPSLDTLVPHPLDTAISPPQLRNAVQLLEGACAQLCATLARPSHTVLNKSLQFLESSCLDVITTFKIPDILQDYEHPASGMHVKELGAKAGINHEKLGRIMRLLATKHIFREVSKDCFANNRLSLQLLSSNPLTTMVSFLVKDIPKATSMLIDVLSDPEWGNSDAAEKSPWNKLTGFDGTFFQFLEGVTPEGAKQGIEFGIAMRGWNDATQATAVLTDFPWGQLPPGTTIADVGGGIGTISMNLLKSYPHLHLKLQDLPERIRQAETEVWPRLLPSAIVERRIEFKPIDFFVEKPVEGCDVYYLKHIMHDWPDKECIQILRNVRAVLKPSARILLQDYVLQHAHRTNAKRSTSESAFTEAPEPVLANYGAGQIRQYYLDMVVMVTLNSRERTLEEFVEIARKADLRFVKLWKTGEMGVVEFQCA